MIELKKVEKRTEFKSIEKLANEILHEVYDPIIPSEHTDYFLAKFQSEKAIENQITNENFVYYLLNFDGKSVGYLGIQILNNKLILSKLYILKSFRGLKIGKTALEFAHKFARKKRFDKIELIVNQKNKNTIDIYLKNGFKIVESIVNSFPNGHSVEDYKMEKLITENY
ncbi:GNAT family N-acetyltransferase [Tenacibaculum caenipelagi]|uniref:Ribosomal protein S18 acetylase RimI-like enzyme n=1 Tax=Tenacibaculum caenipelagi TaxID=1325435 RepID=A0A4R6TFS6_9FLAO|nr:GNAT family N-acetyltransferase [Tenacibaculum caenipelagi]TDQ27529.1 ribosomal protein S18 acetylase RimI-like enzyme [Tenacibaculum caenipelagi]